MSAPADNHPAINGQTFDDWWATQVPDRAPAGPRHARRRHARPGWWRSLLARCWQAQRDLKARLHAWNQATIAERISETPNPWGAGQLALLPEVTYDAGLAAGPEDPYDVLTDEEWADELVGAAGPSEVPADTFNHAPEPEPEPEPAPEKYTDYPGWATGQFKAVDAKLGAGQ